MYSLDCPEFPNLELGELIILKYMRGTLELNQDLWKIPENCKRHCCKYY